MIRFFSQLIYISAKQTDWKTTNLLLANVRNKWRAQQHPDSLEPLRVVVVVVVVVVVLVNYSK
jgi:hypothetical protein